MCQSAQTKSNGQQDPTLVYSSILEQVLVSLVYCWAGVVDGDVISFCNNYDNFRKRCLQQNIIELCVITIKFMEDIE